MSYRILLAKILPAIYVDDFIDGNLHMNSDSYFTQLEASDNLRFDAHEGADSAWQIQSFEVKSGTGDWAPVGGVQNPLTYGHGNKESRNILCMYMFTDKKNFRFDKKNIGFGNMAVVITDAKEFVRRFKDAAEANRRHLQQGPVEYIDKNSFNGIMGPFRKFSTYAYQSEFRFVLSNGNSQSIKFLIGNIRDISFVCPSMQLPQLAKSQQGNSQEN